MAFGDNIENILPNYLVDPDKERLKEALRQFLPESKGAAIDYSSFYNSGAPFDQFMQTDLMAEIRYGYWHNDQKTFETIFSEAIIISNSCDISPQNSRGINVKQCLFAPIIPFGAYIQNLREAGQQENRIESFSVAVKSQMNTNTFYLPKWDVEGNDYIVLLDQVFQFPTEELNSYLPNIQNERIRSLSLFGYYLFILKLSYHLCRLPEEMDRAF